MKKVLKKVSMLFCIISVFLLIKPNFISASSNEYKSVLEEYDFNFNEIKIEKVKFVDNSDTKSNGYGLKGEISNEDNKDYLVKVKVNYYDNSYNQVTFSEYNQVISKNSSVDYLQISDSSNITVNKITYYTLELETSEYVLKNNTPSTILEFKDNPYVIDSYDINVKVNENNTLKITEKITVYFNEKRHGIVRTIPLTNYIRRADGSKNKAFAKISNVKVKGADYSKEKNGSQYEITIGSEDKLVEGKQEYIISYNYNLGKEKNKGFDELYFNLIGDSWDTVIGNISFSVTMPKEFDSSKLGFSTSGDSAIYYQVKDYVIQGSYNGILDRNNALTMRLELDDNYFVGDSDNNTVYLIIMYVLPVLFLIISIYLWYKYGKDDEVIETIEFNPPDNLNSLEIAYYYKGKASNEDVISLLVYLASKGYLKIEEIASKSILKDKNFKITKLKEYAGKNELEKEFMEGLFKQGKEDENGNCVVSKDDLDEDFYQVIVKVLQKIDNQKEKDKIFTKESQRNGIIVLIFILLALISLLAPILLYMNLSLFMLLFALVGCGMLFVMRNVIVNQFKISKLYNMIPSIIAVSFMFIPIFIIAFDLKYVPYFILPLIIGIICVIGMIICLKYMDKRTKEGNRLLGKIEGFKRFLETAEKDKLETLVEENPTYFYDILPYAYVLGVSNKWIKNFESITLVEPEWYSGVGPFEIYNFNMFLNLVLRDSVAIPAAANLKKVTSNGGSGGFSGGGFSGGGFGGGGGSSW